MLLCWWVHCHIQWLMADAVCYTSASQHISICSDWMNATFVCVLSWSYCILTLIYVSCLWSFIAYGSLNLSFVVCCKKNNRFICRQMYRNISLVIMCFASWNYGASSSMCWWLLYMNSSKYLKVCWFITTGMKLTNTLYHLPVVITSYLLTGLA